MPFQKTNDWIEKEKKMGSPGPSNGVLATANKAAIPHCRIVALKEISPGGILFFTQRGTRKVSEMTENPLASMTIWLPLQQREVIIDGHIEALSQEENDINWKTYPRARQLRFSAYASFSGKIINSISELEQQQECLEQEFKTEIPVSEYYCGFRLIPHTFYFYTLGSTTFSEVVKYQFINDTWQSHLVSP